LILVGRTIFVADAHRDDSQRFIERAYEKLTAFMELESAIRVQQRTDSHFICQLIVNGFGTLGTSTAVPFLHAERAVDSKQGGLPARLASHNIDPRNCAEAVSILVAGAVYYRTDCSCKCSDIDFAPRIPAGGFAARESPHPITNRRLCDFKHLPCVSSRELCELARVVSSHHDTGSDA
jgi:hypothetical protein